MSKGVRIGVDLGGTKIEAVALDADGAQIARERIDSPRGDYQATVEAVVAQAALVTEIAGVDKAPLGVGIPGSISPKTGLVRNANSVWLNGRPFEADLAAAHGAPVRIANDANCFALSEAVDGAGAGARSVFGVIIGTGVGGGLIADGKLIGGANGVAGEWGHTPLPSPTVEERDALSCWCGRRNCLETWLSGPALAADYARAAGLDPECAGVAGRDVASRAEAGDAAAIGAIARHGERLGRALAVIVNVFDPEVIVFGGGLSNLDGVAERAWNAMRPHVFSDTIETKIVGNHHGDSSGVRGAAWLWPVAK